jgi:hypothetical protein
MDAEDPNHTNDNKFYSSAASQAPMEANSGGDADVDGAAAAAEPVPIVPPRPAESPSKRGKRPQRISFANEVQYEETFHPEDYDRTNDAYDIEKNVVEMEMEVRHRKA